MKRGMIKVTFVVVLILGLFLSFSCTTNNECYDVTIDLAGGTADNELNYRCLPGTKLLLFTPEKDGYDFVGWQYGDKVITSDILEINESLVLTALWEIKTFYITLDLDGGSCESTKIPIRYQALIELPTPTKPGFKFMGWYESDHLFVDKTYNRTTNLTVRAKWESLDYTITLKNDDDIYQTISIKYNDELVLPKLQKDGYTFMGWSLNGNTFEDDRFQFEENIVLDAVWMPNTYKITLKDETTTEIEITYGDTINLPVLSKTGYKFLGWYLDDNLFTESKWIRLDDIILVAKWEKIAYEIKLIDDEITTIKIFYGDVINITTPSKCGYNFLGWYEDDLLFTDTIWNRCENITLKARYEKIVYTITLKDDETKTIKIKIDDEINLPSLEKTGFSFLGWYNGDELFTDTIWNRYENLTLVARWEEVSNKELINQFNILCYNTQNSDYDQLSLYKNDEGISASKYWQKIGITKVDDNYYVSGIARSGESLASLGPYDYVVLAYNAYTRYSEFVSMDISIGDLVVFSDDLSLLTKGSVDIVISFYHETKVLPPLEIIYNSFNERYHDISVVEGDLDLIDYYDGFMVKWVTSNKDVITTTGEYNKPFTTREVTLKAMIEDQEVYSFTFEVPGKNETSNAIAAGYFYTNAGQITENTIERLDIMYCSFAYVNANAEFTNVSETSTFVKNIRTYVLPYAKKYGTKVLVSINESNDAFGTIAMNSELSKKFANNIVSLIKMLDLDGIDIDWEYPTVEETTYFTTMMKDIYDAVKANNPNHLVTAAIGGGKWQPPRYDLTNSHKYLDYINLMTYSMTSGNGQFQNALYKSSKGYTLTSCSIEESIAIYDGYEVPRHKILVGLAFYGIRQYGSNGLGTSSTNSASISYRGIYETYLTNVNPQVIIGYDEESESPYIYDAENKILISYENERSIARKCEYVNSIGLGGVMYWQDGHDYEDILLNAVCDNIRK